MHTRFDQLELHADLLRALEEVGYTELTPIQAKAIPQVLDGRDIMGAAQTGTGKTAAFSLPILHLLMREANFSASPARHPIRALMLTPTRELADQVSESVKAYARHTPLRTACVFGGVDINPQIEELRKGVEIVVATPGRLLDHLQAKSLSLAQVRFVVLDEADRMLDIGFLPDLQRILAYLPRERQNLLFSATFSPEIRKLAQSYLSNPISVEVARPNATASGVEQQIIHLRPDHKRAALVALLREFATLQALVFVNRKMDAARLARLLSQDGIKADALHGDISQNERLAVLAKFKANEIDVLVATDVAARGLDIKELPLVVNFDLPISAEDYVHRIGRTGRAGAEGLAIALTSDEETRQLADIEKLIGKKLPHREFSLARVEHDTRQESRARREHKVRWTAENSGASDTAAGQPLPQATSPAPASRGGHSGHSGHSGYGTPGAHAGRGAQAPRTPRSRAPHDPWFDRPYEPPQQAPTQDDEAATPKWPQRNIRTARKVAALLK